MQTIFFTIIVLLNSVAFLKLRADNHLGANPLAEYWWHSTNNGQTTISCYVVLLATELLDEPGASSVS